MNDRAETIAARLREAFSPASLDVVDESHLHAGHAGAKSGGGHFDVTIVSARFAGENQISRHRMIYQALDDLMRGEIHALSIKAYTPDEL